MSLLSRVKDLVTFRDLPASRPVEVRQVGGVVVPTYQLGKPQWLPRTPDTYLAEYGRVVTVYACINRLANSAASAPVRVYDDAGGGQRTEIEDHPLRQLMRRPNPFMGEARFLRLVTKIAAASGFCVVEKWRNRALFDGDPGRVGELWPLRSDWIRPIPRDNAPPDWEYRVPGRQPQTLKAQDAVVFAYEDDPSLGYTGVSPLAAALREVGIKNAMLDFTKLFFDNGTMVQYALIPQDNAELDQADADLLREKWKQRYGGVGSAAEVAVLTSIKDVRRIGLDFDEMAYPDLASMTEVAICEAFGVPPILIGIQAGLDAGTYSNYGQARRAFYEDTITPLWGAIDDALTLGLLPEFAAAPTVSLEFDTSDVPALQDDVTPTWTRAGAAVQQGWATVADARREAGLPELPGTEVFLRSIAQVEVPAQVNGNGSRATVVEGEYRSINGNKATTLSLTEGWNVSEWPQDKRIRVTGGLYRLAPEQRVTAAQSAKATIARLGDNFAPQLVAFWREQGQRIVSASKRGVGLTGNTHTVIGWLGSPVDVLDVTPADYSRRDIAEIAWNDEEEELRQVLRRLYLAAGESAATAVGTLTGQAGFSFDLANPWVRHVLNQLATRVTDISDTTRKDVQRIVGDALTEGVTLDELGQRLTGLFEETYKSRAYTVGRTESMVAYNTASVAGYRETGVVGMVELADSSTHCEDYGASDGLSCCDRNGLLVELGNVERHIAAEHPNGSLAVLPVLATPLGEV